MFASLRHGVVRKSTRRAAGSRAFRRLPFAAAFETMEPRQVLSGCPAGFAVPSFVRAHGSGSVAPLATSGPTGLSPATVRHAYGFDAVSFGATAATGAGTTIAIVDAYDSPTVADDLKRFDAAFGLPDPVFRKVNQTGGTTMPAADPGWAGEIALDVQWAHAIAPGADILLVEAKSNSMSDLMTAVNYARNQPGVVAVSMSWGGGEFSGETTYDATFTTPSGHGGVVFFASSGDTGAPVSYPAASPNVVSVGGTSLYVSSGGYGSESGWSGSGGGISAYESQPSWQNGFVSQSSTRRANPDVAYDSDPSTGFPVYDSHNNGTTNPWSQFGGTSAAAPQWAALAAITAQGRAAAGLGPLDGRTQFLPAIYQVAAADFHDVTTGSSTGSPSYSATAGYDLVTGRGTPVANRLIPDLVAWGGGSQTVTAPSAPTSFTATATSSTQASLSWGASAGADGYWLYQVSGGTATLLASYPSTATTATVSGLSAGTTYTFRLDAYNAAGTASATTQVTTPTASAIAAPTGVTVTLVTKTSAQVSWNASAGATGYSILVSNGTSTSTVATVSARTTSLRVGNLSRGTTYSFAVKAFNATSSATSPWVSIATPAIVQVAAPQGLSLLASSPTTGTLSWKAAADATGYRVFAVEVGGRGQASAFVDGSATSVDVSGLRSGRTYRFQVVAMNDDSYASSDWITFSSAVARAPSPAATRVAAAFRALRRF